MKRTRFVPINSKVNSIIIVALVVGIGSISFYLTTEITTSIDDLLEQNFDQQSTILSAAIENYMLPGEAELAVGFFNTMMERSDDYSIFLFRRNGQLAFSDSSTLEDVVQRLPPAFAARFDTMADRMFSSETVMETHFATAVGFPPSTKAFETQDADGRVYSRAYVPLINLPKCTACHGADHTVRGVIDIRQDITASRLHQKNTVYLAGGFFLGLVVLMAIILANFMRRTVIKPVKTVGQVCQKVTEGDFDQKVTLRSHDEIGRLGDTVNKMVDGLHERFQLSKYVSSSTIESLGETKEGHAVSMTMLFSDIRGFTAYSEKRSPEQVVENLNGVLNVQTEIIQRYKGDIDKYVGDEIVAMFNDDEQKLNACRAALEIQKVFRSESDTSHDGLTLGLGINTGEVILGMIGSEKRADYTFIGDNVNTASRLCDAAAPGQILIADSTYESIADKLVVEGPYRLKAKGKDEYVRVYDLKDVKGEAE
jgi:adenylate cyclase